MPNRLAHESSPYLLQHQNNPVDWYPWCGEALARSTAEEKPIFLSIGYSACHWCHVMEHESFEKPEIAELLNERFVCIKVDREERPDLDHIYMNAVQMMTGRGGWPMSVFLTPALEPFYGGTYWPPHDSRGMPGFDRIILAVHDAWLNRRDQVFAQAGKLTAAIQAVDIDDGSAAPLTPDLLLAAGESLARSFDSRDGGFGAGPKFPHSMDLQLLLRLHTRLPEVKGNRSPLAMVQFTLDKMAAGGIYDHLAGGFARYSVDERWLVPHFEKMLYDNALLILAYLESYQATGEPRYARVAEESIEYILRDMTDATGMFHSTEDADSEGEEGKFYVWTPTEIQSVLGRERGERFCSIYDVTAHGNFEHGMSILNLPKTIEQWSSQHGCDVEQLRGELDQDRAALLKVRDSRVRPGKDDKVLVSWNALMIDALARAAGILNQPRYLTAAEKAAAAILRECRNADGRLLHAWRHGKAKLSAYLDDYTYLLNALVSLYEASFEERYLAEAIALAEAVLEHFGDPAGGFFYTANDHEQLIARHKELQDNSVPSGNSMAALALLRLGKLTGNTKFLDAAHGTLQSARNMMQRAPTAVGQMLMAADLAMGPTMELVFVGGNEADRAEVLQQLRSTFLPRAVVAWRRYHPVAQQPETPQPLDALFEGRDMPTDGEIGLYVCQDFACQAPVFGVQAISERLAQLAAVVP